MMQEELQAKAIQLFSDQNYDELIPVLSEMVEQGSVWAMHYLASCHAYGLGIEKSMVEANRLHLAAAELGIPEAQMALGYNLLTGDGIEKDVEQGVRRLTEAMDGGVGYAAYVLGEQRAGINDNRTQEDYLEAAEFFAKAAHLGDHRGMQRLAWFFTEGLGVEKNAEEALKLNVTAADLGNEVSALNAGVAFEYGRGTEIDFSRAFKYYEMAAGKNVVRAMHNLGAFYFNGQGVERDSSQAFKWYLAAANQGSWLSSYCLARMYEDGDKEADITPHSLAMATAWYLIAESELNGPHDQISEKISSISRELSAEEKAKTIHILETFSEKGFHWAQKALSLKYLDGMLCDVNPSRAEKWKAAAGMSQGEATELLRSQESIA